MIFNYDSYARHVSYILHIRNKYTVLAREDYRFEIPTGYFVAFHSLPCTRPQPLHPQTFPVHQTPYHRCQVSNTSNATNNKYTNKWTRSRVWAPQLNHLQHRSLHCSVRKRNKESRLKIIDRWWDEPGQWQIRRSRRQSSNRQRAFVTSQNSLDWFFLGGCWGGGGHPTKLVTCSSSSYPFIRSGETSTASR